MKQMIPIENDYMYGYVNFKKKLVTQSRLPECELDEMIKIFEENYTDFELDILYGENADFKTTYYFTILRIHITNLTYLANNSSKLLIEFIRLFFVSQDINIRIGKKIESLTTVLLEALNNITIDTLIKDSVEFLLTNKRKDLYLIKFIGKFYPDIEKLPLSYLNLIKTLEYENAAVEGE